MIALFLAAALVPAQAQGALVVEDVTGLRAFFQAAGKHAPSLGPSSLGRTLRDSVGIDLFAEQPEWALAKKGARVLVFMDGSAGISAPVASAKSARKALEAWLGAPSQKQKRPTAAGDRAGMIAPVGGSQRVLLASGRHAAALVSAMAHPKPLKANGKGPAWLWLRGQAPIRDALFQLDASSTGLVARGLVTSSEALLDSSAPAPCEGAPIGCLRASLGPAGHAVFARALQALALPPSQADHVLGRLDGIDVQKLAGDTSLPQALRFSIADAPAKEPPGLSASVDLAAIAAALARLTPLDALHGSLAAEAYAFSLLYGALLRNAGPLTVTGVPAKGGANLEARLPVR